MDKLRQRLGRRGTFLVAMVAAALAAVATGTLIGAEFVLVFYVVLLGALGVILWRRMSDLGTGDAIPRD